MFFTLLSKILFKSTNRRSYFYLFVSGAILYIILHYYLNCAERGALLQKLNSYLYYVMTIDFVIGCYLVKGKEEKSNNKKVEDDGDSEDEDESKNESKGRYSDAQRQQIMTNLKQAKNMSNGEDSSSPFIKKGQKDEEAKQAREQYMMQQEMQKRLQKQKMYEAMQRKQQEEAMLKRQQEEAQAKEVSESSDMIKRPNRQVQTNEKTQPEQPAEPEGEDDALCDTDLPVFNDDN